MQSQLREAKPEELDALGELCMRSKAHWGYDQAFMEACRRELTLQPDELHTTHLAVAEQEGRVAGLVQVVVDEKQAELFKLFVEPERIGNGIGRRLWDWAVVTAKTAGAKSLFVDADPGAEAFYIRMGARNIGMAPSGSITGRQLPRLVFDL